MMDQSGIDMIRTLILVVKSIKSYKRKVNYPFWVCCTGAVIPTYSGILYHLHSKQNSRKGWIYMKKENS